MECFSFNKEKLEVTIKQSFLKIKEAAIKKLEIKVYFCKKQIKKNEKNQGATSELVRYFYSCTLYTGENKELFDSRGQNKSFNAAHALNWRKKRTKKRKS